MPSFEKEPPELTRKGLQRRRDRSMRALVVVRETMPAEMAMNLRREARALHRDIMEAPDLDSRAKAVSAAVAIRSQLLDVISWPKRPASAPHKPGSRPLIPVDAMPMDVQDIIRQEDSQAQDSQTPEA